MQFTVARQVSGIKTSLESTRTHVGHLTLPGHSCGASPAVNMAVSLAHSCRLKPQPREEAAQRRQPDTAAKEEFTSVTVARHSPVL